MPIKFIVGLCWLIFCANSFACYSPIKSDEEVIFFPTIGYPMADGKNWALTIHGWIYEPPSSIKRKIRGFFNWEEEKEESKPSIFQERLRAFFVDNERGKKIAIRFGEKCIQLNNQSAPNGHFSEILHLSSTEIEKWRYHQGKPQPFILFQAVTRANDLRRFEGKIQLMDQTGLSIISDLDDTIKISEVRDKSALLANTFKRPFQAVPGMAQFYHSWLQNENTSFHYVSASPWQLYQPLNAFLAENHFPTGSFHLRQFRWKDKSFFKFLFQSSRPHKIESIQTLIDCCHERRVILIGDSGEQDPEIYAQIAHQYPQQIAHIFIRDVTNEPKSAIRYQTTFQKLPKSLWTVFQEIQSVEKSKFQEYRVKGRMPEPAVPGPQCH